ncbi:unnamed protein product [Pleuronectes platessa]|uniref:Protein phosphatase 1 regulatory subunit 37 n=1 Tax=Pleuronectes platessa TaxID=8262 RepID=A0A9N7TSM2_PLEPL|nr:unnamed protein product [Pleuronectes platessa]
MVHLAKTLSSEKLFLPLLLPYLPEKLLAMCWMCRCLCVLQLIEKKRSQPVLKVLQVLDLAENLLGNEGIQVIRTPLMVNCSVLQLGLAQANITCEGAVALAEFLAENRHIQRLDLRQNKLKVGGLMALCLSLRINHSLTHLDLDDATPEEQRPEENDAITSIHAPAGFTK